MTILAGPMIADGTYRHHLGDEDLNRMCQLGTFSEYMVVNEGSVVKIDEGVNLRAAALISCGLSTGFGAAVDRAKVRPGETVIVVGCGGVGSGAIQGARIAGAEHDHRRATSSPRRSSVRSRSARPTGRRTSSRLRSSPPSSRAAGSPTP